MKKVKKILCLVLVLMLVVALFAMPATATSAPTEMTNFIQAGEAPASVLKILDESEVPYNSNSTIQVINEKSGQAASALCIRTEKDNLIEYTTLLSFSQDENGDAAPDDFENAVFKQSRAGGVNENIWHGTRIRATTVYESHNSGQYIRALSEMVICYNYSNGVLPSKIYLNTTLAGDLYSVNGSTYTKLSENYVYTNPYTVYSPKFNTVYSHDKYMASNRAVDPYVWMNGFAFCVRATFSDRDYEWDAPVVV